MKLVSVIALWVLIVALIIFFPFAVIWALNTLFALGIAYTFWTWLAMVVVISFFGTGHRHTKTKK
jgi:hypothetical protein